MANNYAYNPWYIDTLPAVWQPDVNGNPTIIPLKIRTIVWSGQGAAGDTCLITDARGHVIWNAQAYNTDFQQESPNIGWVQGFKVVTLASGHLQVYMDFKA